MRKGSTEVGSSVIIYNTNIPVKSVNIRIGLGVGT